MRLNDGGVSYLAEALAEVCKPGMKHEQTRNRLLDLNMRTAEILSPFFVPTDAEQRVAERTAIAEQTINDFEECVARQSFGAFLRALCLDRGDLFDAFYEARMSGALFKAKSEASANLQAASPPPPRPGGLLATIKSGRETPRAERRRDCASQRATRKPHRRICARRDAALVADGSRRLRRRQLRR